VGKKEGKFQCFTDGLKGEPRERFERKKRENTTRQYNLKEKRGFLLTEGKEEGKKGQVPCSFFARGLGASSFFSGKEKRKKGKPNPYPPLKKKNTLGGERKEKGETTRGNMNSEN